jgi:hypothetical protein
MAILTTRADKGSPLTNSEMDTNLTNLRDRWRGFDENGVHAVFNGDLNTVLHNSIYNFTGNSVTNEPSDFLSTGWGFLHSMMYYNNAAEVDYGVQIIYGMNDSNVGKIWKRVIEADVWGSWECTTNTDVMQFLTNNTMHFYKGISTQVDAITGSTFTISFDEELLKTWSITSDITINESVNAWQFGELKIRISVDSTDRTVSLGTGVSPIGTIPTLVANSTYEMRITRYANNESYVEVVEMG